MKRNYLFFLLVLIAFGCKKSFDPANPDADQFISLVKKGGHDPHELPRFNASHIDRLLELAIDTSHIAGFPGNPISSRSSLPGPDGRKYMILSECLLWTVEGIRNGSGYGSLNPYLVVPSEKMSGISVKEILEVREMYKSSWQGTGKSLTKWASENPLENTGYRWY
jgi:hypothetical protein